MELFDRQKNTVGQDERTLLVYVEQSSNRYRSNGIAEFIQLADSSGLHIVQTIEVKINHPSVKYYIGKGKTEELKTIVTEKEIDLVIFSAELSPSQERNLEKSFKCQVMDRTGLILDIFALRARSYEGKLQVELAHYNTFLQG